MFQELDRALFRRWVEEMKPWHRSPITPQERGVPGESQAAPSGLKPFLKEHSNQNGGRVGLRESQSSRNTAHPLPADPRGSRSGRPL